MRHAWCSGQQVLSSGKRCYWVSGWIEPRWERRTLVARRSIPQVSYWLGVPNLEVAHPNEETESLDRLAYETCSQEHLSVLVIMD